MEVLREGRGFGITRACGLLGMSQSLYGYHSRRPPCSDQQRICELAGEKRRYGYRRSHILVPREGCRVNRNALIGCTERQDLRSTVDRSSKATPPGHRG